MVVAPQGFLILFRSERFVALRLVRERGLDLGLDVVLRHSTQRWALCMVCVRHSGASRGEACLEGGGQLRTATPLDF